MAKVAYTPPFLLLHADLHVFVVVLCAESSSCRLSLALFCLASTLEGSIASSESGGAVTVRAHVLVLPSLLEKHLWML